MTALLQRKSLLPKSLFEHIIMSDESKIIRVIDEYCYEFSDKLSLDDEKALKSSLGFSVMCYMADKFREIKLYAMFNDGANPNDFYLSFDEFMARAKFDESLKDMLFKYGEKYWDLVLKIANLSPYLNELLGHCVFNETYTKQSNLEYQINEGVSDFIYEISDFSAYKNILLFSSLSDNLFLDMTKMVEKSKLEQGIIEDVLSDINFSIVTNNSNISNQIKLKSKVLNANTNIINYSDLKNEKFDLICADLVFNNRIDFSDFMLDKISKEFEIDLKNTRTHDEWLKIAQITQLLGDNSFAFCICSRFLLSNDKGKLSGILKERLLKKGYIKAIINLPKEAINGIGIECDLLILSKGNKSIKMIDARSLYHKELNFFEYMKLAEYLQKNNELSKTLSFEEALANRLNVSLSLEDSINTISLKELILSSNVGATMQSSEIQNLKCKQESDFALINTSNIKEGYIKDDDFIEQIPEKYQKLVVKNNSIIIPRVWNESIKVAFVSNYSKKLLPTNNVIALELDESKIYPPYVAAFLQSEKGVESIKNLSSNGALSRLSIGGIKELKIPMRSEVEQRQIGDDFIQTIEKIQALQNQYEAELNKLKIIFK
ncbi:N-6 DNA methylase [Campylobacter sp. RM12642]|uniref:N-6 DNA methylase n=1 Tax=unclassified Campylobacter TaxID=2593542 RepID=UPI001DFFFE87|nr:N-6 DNA methylase [Campylobacter sp. RM12642]MBZ8008097.1 N-6 DNA methylase [Campylobacter sp. RM9334]